MGPRKDTTAVLDMSKHQEALAGTARRKPRKGATASTRAHKDRAQQRRSVNQTRADSQQRGSNQRTSQQTRANRGRSRTQGTAQNTRRSGNKEFIRYAADNRLVRVVHALTTGKARVVFVLGVLVLVGFVLYSPLCSWYAAFRTNGILEQQVDLREAYNKGLDSEVKKLLSQEGIEEIARTKLGMVLPGETRIDIEGSGSSKSSDDLKIETTTQLEAAEEAIAEYAPWYFKFLDKLLGFKGVEGQTVSSTGAE